MAVAGDRLLDRLRSLRLVAGGNSRETGDRVQPHSAKTFHPNRARHRRVDCIWLLHGEELGMRETPAAPTSEQLAEREGARYELLDPSVLQDPYPLYRQMRDEAPVYRDRRFMGWILTRYDDVLAVLRDPRVSSNRPLASGPVGWALAPIATVGRVWVEEHTAQAGASSRIIVRARSDRRKVRPVRSQAGSGSSALDPTCGG